MRLQWIDMDVQGGSSMDSERLQGLRARLLCPLLRTILIAVAPLKGSPEVQGAACLFIRTFHRTLQHILDDAASMGTRLWEPGTQELKLATLVLQLLTQVWFSRGMLSSDSTCWHAGNCEAR